MSRCRACGRGVRVTSLALVASEVGWAMGRVCRACARRGLLVVAPALAHPPILKPSRDPVAVRAKRKLTQLRKTLEHTGAADLKIEGVDAALAILDAESL